MSRNDGEAKPEQYPNEVNNAQEMAPGIAREKQGNDRPARWRRVAAGVSAALAIGAVQGAEAQPAHADHEDTGAPDVNTWSRCNSGKGAVKVGIQNLSTGHWLDATLEIPYFDSPDNTWEERLSPADPETHQPTDNWQLGSLSGDASMPPGEVGYTLVWEGHDDGQDHVATGTLAYPGIECPYEGTKGSESYSTTGDSGRGGAVSPVERDRWDGATRIETGIVISRNTYDEYDEAENAVLTTSQDFPDALAGTPLAAASEGPLLLTGSEELHEGVASELERLGVNHVYVLGGDAAVSEHVERQLGGRGYQVTRLDGDNRFETAAEIAREHQALTEQPEVVDGDPETDTATSNPETDTTQTPEEVENEVLLADGGDFADALAGGSLGAQEGSPILLTPSESLHTATEEYLQNEQVDRVTTLGGSAAVSQSVEREAAAAAETEDVDRLAGSTRIDTAIEIADEKLGRSGDRVINAYFASAYDWPDALAGGYATSQEGDVLLLANGHDAEANHALDPFIAAQRPDVDRDQWETVTILGGTAAISADVEADLIYRVNAHPTSDDSSTTSNDSSVSAITTDVAADDPDETRRSQEIARKDEINSNSRAVVTYDASGKPQVELENAA